jgi:transglutaminase-like putative cysteine protease
MLMAGEPSTYLLEDEVVDVSHPAVRELSARLGAGRADEIAFARAAFTWVRDEIRHSWDAQDPRVTLTASETLREGVGLCYAKAHLLAAVLRGGGVPTGLCYQTLLGDDGSGHVLHGLVAVHLRGGWHRQDPRGNKPGIDARFSLGPERLAWPTRPELGEVDHPDVLAHPHPEVVARLRTATDILALASGGLPTTF